MEGAKTAAKEQERTVLLRTITDGPLLIRRLLQHKKELAEDFVQHFLTYAMEKVYFNGQASDTFVGDMPTPCIKKLLQVETEICNPASFPEYLQFNINQQYSPDEILILCPTHSGTTTGPIRVTQGCKRSNILVMCITIDSNSPLTNLSDIVTNKLCGSEESFIKTRTHMALLLIAFLCIIEATNQKGLISRQQYIYYQQYFTRLEGNVNQIIKDTADQYKNHRELLRAKMVTRYIGASPYCAVAQGGDLKIAEAASITTLACEQEEFMHTGTTQIQKGTLLFLIAPDGVQEIRTPELIRWCRLYSDCVILITNRSHPLKDSEALLYHFQDDPYCSVMECMVPFQMLAHLLTEDRGLSIVHAANDGTSAYLKTYTEEVWFMKYIIATYGYLADGYISSIQVLTKRSNICVANAYVDDRGVALQLETIIGSFENQGEIIIFTGLMCESMTQAVAPYLDRYNIRCITGINLPLILEFVLTTSTIDDAYIGHTIQETRKQMVFVNHLLKQTR